MTPADDARSDQAVPDATLPGYSDPELSAPPAGQSSPAAHQAARRELTG